MNIANDVEGSIDSNFPVHTPVFAAVFVADCADFVVVSDIGPGNSDNRIVAAGLVDFDIASYDNYSETKIVGSAHGTRIVVFYGSGYCGTNSVHETVDFVLEARTVDSVLEAKTVDSALEAMIAGSALETRFVGFVLEAMSVDSALEVETFDQTGVETIG